jgi:ribonuclease HI
MKKYYAYFVPEENLRGITDDWKECEKMVSGKSEAKYKSFNKKEDAEEWLKRGADYTFKKIQEPGIYFDAGTGRGEGVEVSVTDETGKNILAEIIPDKLNKFGKYNLETGLTNNYGELLACKFALEIALKKEVKKVFGDSRLIINYWSKGFVKEENISRETSKLIDEAMFLRNKFEENGGAIIYISGAENPADLGFHK